MSMDATLQVRMDGQIKNNVEELYRNLGTSFAEAVRIFAQQSLLVDGMPFRPTLKPWKELTEAEINHKLATSEEDILAGRILSQTEADERLKAKFHHE
jgi:DNA-damage-inducible protein J